MLFTNTSYQEKNIIINNSHIFNNNQIQNQINIINNGNVKPSLFLKNMFITASPSDKCVSCGH